MNLKDQYLLLQIKKGNIKSFEEVFHRFYQGLCLYAKTVLKNQEVSEEIVQEVFYNIWKNRENLGITISLNNYLYKSVFNNSLMYLRKMKRELHLDDKVPVEKPDEYNDPSSLFDSYELNKAIEKTIRELPQRTRKIFMLNRMEGLRYKEIADKLSVSVKTVEADMGKALKAFRNSLKEFYS